MNYDDSKRFYKLKKQLKKTRKRLDDVDRRLCNLEHRIVGISIDPGIPHPRSPVTSGGFDMSAKKVVMTCCKKSAMRNKMAASGAKAAPGQFGLVDNEDGTATIMGKDLAGALVAIDTVAAITSVVSDNTAVLTVGSPTGVTFPYSGVAPGTANIGADVAWNDGSVGPFHGDAGVTVSGSAVAGLAFDFGTPIPRP